MMQRSTDWGFYGSSVAKPRLYREGTSIALKSSLGNSKGSRAVLVPPDLQVVTDPQGNVPLVSDPFELFQIGIDFDFFQIRL